MWQGACGKSREELAVAAARAGIDLDARGETLAVADFARSGRGARGLSSASGLAPLRALPGLSARARLAGCPAKKRPRSAGRASGFRRLFRGPNPRSQRAVASISIQPNNAMRRAFRILARALLHARCAGWLGDRAPRGIKRQGEPRAMLDGDQVVEVGEAAASSGGEPTRRANLTSAGASARDLARAREGRRARGHRPRRARVRPARTA